MIKPNVIYVSGAPGSGKTTLAKLLAEQLYVPYVSSDLIHGGIAFLRPKHDRKETLKNVFVPTMIDMSKKGISFVADHVLQKNLSEKGIIDRLRPYANIIYVHTKAADPIKRYTDRVKNSNLPSFIERQNHLLGLAAYHQENLLRTSETLDLNLPTITVNTDDGYDPTLSTIITFIKQHSES